MKRKGIPKHVFGKAHRWKKTERRTPAITDRKSEELFREDSINLYRSVVCFFISAEDLF